MKTKLFPHEQVEQRIAAAVERMRQRIDSGSIDTQVVRWAEAAGAIHAQLRQATNRELNIEG